MENRKFTIVKKGLALIALPAISQLLLLGFLLRMQSDAIEAERWTAHSRLVLAASEDVFRYLAEAQADIRGYVVTSNPLFDQSVAGPLRHALDSLDQLHSLVSDNPPQQFLVEHIRTQAQYYEKWAQDVRDLVRAGNQADAVAHLSDLSGKARLDAVEEGLSAFKKEEERLNAERHATLVGARLLQRWVLILATGGIFVIAIVVAILFGIGFSRRLGILTDNARRLAGGQDLAAPVSGSDEIADLDRVLHDSATRLAAAAEAEHGYKLQVEKRANELGVVNQELKQKTQENEMFVYSVSHDLRSPLVNLQGFGKELAHSCTEVRELIAGADLPAPLKTQLLGVVEKEMLDSLRFIQSAVTRSANIIDAMLRLSRAGQLEYRQQRVPVDQIIRRIVDSVAATSAERKAKLLVHEMPDALGDPTALEQVFANLIVNALNYLDPHRAGEIEVGALSAQSGADDHQVTYYVKDNGLGIPEAYRHKVFVAFQRLHGEIVKGEGVGLALVRRIIERHRGKIWVESQEGVGSTFFVSLPAPDGTANETESKSPEPRGNVQVAEHL